MVEFEGKPLTRRKASLLGEDTFYVKLVETEVLVGVFTLVLVGKDTLELVLKMKQDSLNFEETIVSSR